ncbi:MAG: hypothetical protein C4523_05205 [Myxococcales bacterium]|nr:MAG: hypothetical protein C4523_05205 [Myxococcales bacterium]
MAMKRHAVFGRPVMHSLSPILFKAFFGTCGIDAAYIRISEPRAAQALMLYDELGLSGANATSPLKQDLCRLLSSHDHMAMEIGAVNTLVSRNGNLRGYNTDAFGVVAALQEANCHPLGKRCLILGAGGAARAAAFGLKKAEAAEIIVANRTREKAMILAELVDGVGVALDQLDIALPRAEIVVSCLPEGVAGQWPGISSLPRGCLVLEANYRAPDLKDETESIGARYLGGERWLLHQAVEAFTIFHGRRVSSESARHALNSARQSMVKTTSVVLIGFMGAGKTTVGRALARRLDFDFVDTDQAIEQNAGMSISEIFATKGEAAFRELELAEILRQRGRRRTILSVGGGAVANKDIRVFLKSFGTVVWLYAPLGTCLGRVDDRNRPLLHCSDEAIARLYQERQDTYFQTADLLVKADDGDPAEVAARILNEASVFFRD